MHQRLTPAASLPADESDGPSGQSRLHSLLRYDLPASLVVFLVALPLSLGIAVASDAPVLAGIIAAIVGGIVVGFLGGSPLQVSGPAAGLTVIVAGLVGQFGWAVTCAITICAGVLQVLLGLSRIARAALAISPVVVHAMLAGIGVTIALQQTHVLLGGDSASSAWRNVTGLPGQVLHAHGPGTFLGLLVIGILVAWRWVPERVKVIPGPLVAILGVTVLSLVAPFDVSRIVIDGSLVDALQLPNLPDGNWGAFVTGVLTVALIASVESLLSAVSVDRMQSRAPRTNFDRELMGQGVANIASGSIGGLPVTGVIVRSSTNVAAGAQTRASSILHGVWVLAFAVPFAGLAKLIPTAALAGLLIVIGVQLVKWAHIKTAWRTGDLAVYLVTIVGVVFLNLLEGVLIGLALAVSLTVWRVVRVKIAADRTGEDQWRVVIDGSVTFLSLPRLNSVLASVPDGAHVTVELAVDFIDHAGYETIDAWQRQQVASGGSVDIHDVGAVEMDSAVAGPPMRGFTPIDKRTGVVPWSSWQPQLRPSVLHGLAVYHRRTAPFIRPHMKELEHEQRPETLFITCADSRIVPNVITSSGPGDLFTVRNVGNFIPAGRQDVSVDAAIAFAVKVLDVSSIVVCGHSSCGAMNAVLRDGPGQSTGDEALDAWLEYARPALAAFGGGRHPIAKSAAAEGFDTVDQLSMVNVALQVQTLAEHPLLRERYQQGRLDIIGLFYDIPSAGVLRVTPTEVCTFELGHAQS
ncbi:carbonic anhydrase [Mycobacterium syngnathidarum]|uniref:carbonic anhydrase n=1 Tax=Mycobacterium syngnathidarum TaxID=1908205 RepID=A0A1S1KMH8_9MYCO|nr:carbonic anhydrase [Mycobacterium syngnathidarum]OLT97103.1 carbonic anhydrase [Mycobacterium syngnathidarum]